MTRRCRATGPIQKKNGRSAGQAQRSSRQGEQGHGRGVSVVEWAGVDRTHYSIHAGYGMIKRTLLWECFPKDQWTEEEARSYFADRIARLQ